MIFSEFLGCPWILYRFVEDVYVILSWEGGKVVSNCRPFQGYGFALMLFPFLSYIGTEAPIREFESWIYGCNWICIFGDDVKR